MSNRFFLSLTKFFPPTFLSESQIQYVNIDLLHSKYRTTFVATFYFFNRVIPSRSWGIFEFLYESPVKWKQRS